MSDGVISKIQLPDGKVYDVMGGESEIDSTYDSSTHTVTLTVGTIDNADDNEY